jgi:hypothetical protein
LTCKTFPLKLIGAFSFFKTLCMRISRSIFVIVLFYFHSSQAQNTGVGTTTPQEKLDVKGNLNVSGTIKANGVGGQPGQVMRLNTSGNIEWADYSQYSNFIMYTQSSTWVVPAGVTRILIELWGGGGGGSKYGSGGGAGYIVGQFDVTPGMNITFTVGFGGTGRSFAAEDGHPSSVTIGGVTLQAEGGMGSVYNTTFKELNPTEGGGYYVNSASPQRYIGISGSPGLHNSYQYMQSGTSTLEAITGARGGSAGNVINSGGNGGYSLRDITTLTNIQLADCSLANVGGGGGGSTTWGNDSGGLGGWGQVIIRY